MKSREKEEAWKISKYMVARDKAGLDGERNQQMEWKGERQRTMGKNMRSYIKEKAVDLTIHNDLEHFKVNSSSHTQNKHTLFVFALSCNILHYFWYQIHQY